MKPMQWPDATARAVDAAGFEASASWSVAQVNDQVTGSITASGVPIGLDLPCADDPELFFAESPEHVEQAKAMCRGCSARRACLAGALERREPWGVWGGELLMRGTIVPRKRPRGRPRKDEVAA
jgi:WhiB family redox-sensing transcriptional regulator